MKLRMSVRSGAGRRHLRLLQLRHSRRCLCGGGAQLSLEDLAELLPENEIDEEVKVRVEHLEDGAELKQEKQIRRARLPGVRRRRRLKDLSRRITQDEYDDDDDHDEGYVLLVFLATGSPTGTQHRATLPVDASVVDDQTHVEGREKNERQKEADDVVADVEVDGAEPIAAAERRFIPRPLPGIQRAGQNLHFEEAWNVVDDGEDDDYCQANTGAP